MPITRLNFASDLQVVSDQETIDLAFFNKRNKAIADAIAALDTAFSGYGTAEATLVQRGLERLNDTLGPLLLILQSISDLGFLVARSVGDSHSLVQTEAIDWNITENATAFSPTSYLLAVDDNDATNWGLLSLDEGGWVAEEATLATSVVYAAKTQASTSWTISANSAVIPALQGFVTTAQEAAVATAADVATVQSAVDAIQDLLVQMGEAGVASIQSPLRGALTGIVTLLYTDISGLADQLGLKATTAALNSGLASKQAASTKLDTLVALSWAANKLLYATGSGTLGLLDITEFAKTLLDDAAATNVLTTLGFSTFAKTLIDDTDAATARTTLNVYSKTEVDTLTAPNMTQNSKSENYTLVLADAGKQILHPSADTTARVFTIPANASVAYSPGTAITFVNQHGAGTLTIAINSDTMRLAGAGTTGSRTLAADGTATAQKITATEWLISGTGLS